MGRSNTPLGQRVTRYDYINRQMTTGNKTDELLDESDVDLTTIYTTEDDIDLEGEDF
jgi:hypothetical protein